MHMNNGPRLFAHCVVAHTKHVDAILALLSISIASTDHEAESCRVACTLLLERMKHDELPPGDAAPTVPQVTWLVRLC